MSEPRGILVTGGTGALGTAVTRRLLEEGHRVAVSWVVEDEADRTRHELADFADLFLFRADLSQPQEVDALTAGAAARLGSIDALAHLVGMWRGGTPLHEVDDATWDLVMDVNLRSAFNCARAVLPGMLARGWGRLVFVSSLTAHRGQSEQVPYAVAKAGVAALAEAIADETRGRGVTANAVSPSILDTAANRRSFPKSDPARWVAPEDLAATISFLISDAAGPITGAALPVRGGV
ncbi:MAG TPA: SDR family NAD(P)-dependent oxidoreductase [Actinomycetota bacterium]|nr:SDR family NAD(P)-dependent oxidoreductase [Actinomycetota bacterium]